MLWPCGGGGGGPSVVDGAEAPRNASKWTTSKESFKEFETLALLALPCRGCCCWSAILSWFWSVKTMAVNVKARLERKRCARSVSVSSVLSNMLGCLFQMRNVLIYGIK